MSKPDLTPGTFASTTFDAVTCGRVNQFIMAGLADDRYTVRWCAIGDASNWPTPNTEAARTVQAGQQTFPTEFGEITGISGNDFFGYIFHEKAITKASYIGGDVVFAFDTFEESRGCLGLNRYTRANDKVFYQSEFGYHMLENGQVIDIGFGRVDEEYPNSDASATTPTEQKNVVSNSGRDTVFFQDNSLAYNYKTNQWTRIPALAVSSGQVFFDMDSAIGVVGRAIPGNTLGTPVIGIDYQSQETGSSVTATAVTGELQIKPEHRSMIDGIRPLGNGISVSSLRVGVRDLLDESVSWATGTAVHSRTGMSNFRGGENYPEGRYHRMELKFTGGFVTLKGVDVEFYESGEV